MKKKVFAIIIFLVFLLIPSLKAATWYFWRCRITSNCKQLTDGRAQDLCFQSDKRIFKCVPDADNICDTPSEWVEIGYLTSESDPVFSAMDTEAELESHLTDVTNIYTNNDGALTDDDLSDNSIGDLSNVDTTGVIDGKILKYNGTTSKWQVADDADTTYSAGTGLSLSETTFSLSHLGLEDLTDPNANRLYCWNDTNNTTEWLDYSGWDTNASDDLTISTSFSGDVSGTYDNLQLGNEVVTNNNIADDTIAESKLDIYNAPSDGKYLKYTTAHGMEWAEGGGGASQLSDLSDVGIVDYTAGHYLRADGTDYDSASIQDGDLPSSITRDTEWDTETELETHLTDVTNVFTNNDGSLSDDDLSNNSINDLSDVDTTGIANNKILKYNSASSKWEVGDDADTTYTADGQGIELSGTQFSLELDGTTLSKSATGLKVNSITSLEITDETIVNADIADDTIAEAKLDIYNAPTDGYYLKYDATNGMMWAAVSGEGSGDITAVGDVTSGDAFTADGGGNTLYFEGSTANDSEIALTAADPNQDYTITLPAASGTVELQENIDTEAKLESRLTDVTNIYTNNDGNLSDDDLSDNSINDLNDVDKSGWAEGNLLKFNSSGNLVVGTDNVNDADADASNELQNIFQNITDGSNTATADSTTDTFTLEAGTGISVSVDATNDKATITNTGDTDASDDLTTSTSFGGDVSGTYDNLQIQSAAVTTTEIADETIQDGDISSSADTRIAAIEVIIDGGDNAISTGVKADIEVPFNCTILQATALADQTGSIQVDIWKDTYANFPPTDADSITGSNPISISSSNKSQDSTLSGWTTTINAGDILRFNVDSCSTIQRCTISLKVRKD